MKRWALVKMGDFENDGSRVPKLNLYDCASRVWSSPGNEWAVAHFSVKGLGQMQTDPDIILFPDITMGAALSSMPTGARNTLMDQLTARGFTTPSNASATGFKAFLNETVAQLQAGIDVENGDIPDKA